jgi:DNA-binding NtrC family response regulator
LLNILLIDDDPVLLPEQVRQAFPEPKPLVKVAGTGADGVRQVRSEPSDVILLDLRRFRRDLYYRLGVYSIQIPPLRERGDDLGLLFSHCVRRFNHELGLHIARSVESDDAT